jgi:hypothetical protein
VDTLKQPLAFGVTTVLDMHNEPSVVAMLKEAAEKRDDISDMRSACHGATVEGGWPAPIYAINDKSEEV